MRGQLEDEYGELKKFENCLPLPQTSEHMTERLVQVTVLLLRVCVCHHSRGAVWSSVGPHLQQR